MLTYINLNYVNKRTFNLHQKYNKRKLQKLGFRNQTIL